MMPVKVIYHHPAKGEINVGRIVYENRIGLFEYDASFLALNLQLSPFNLPLISGLQRGNSTPFNGLQGVFSDSLPDGWGMRLMDRAIRSRSLAEVTPVERLAYMGSRCMGALSYQPDTGNKGEHSGDEISIAELASESLVVYRGGIEQVAQELYITGGSPGGARPKATIGLQFHHTGYRAISGAEDLPVGYEHWLVKFPTNTDADARAEGTVEYIYSLLARDAGINFPETLLIPSDDEYGYFCCKRFDRQVGNVRVHMHTLAGLIDADFRVCDADYEHLLQVTTHLTKNHQDCLEAVRRMIFNVVVGNRDDHTKNFSFLMDGEGQWRLSPAYDITFNAGPGGEHSMSIAGQGRNITLLAINSLAERFSISKKDVQLMIDDIAKAVAQWPILARDHQVPENMITEVYDYMNAQLLNLC
jgi:serine/threonine-protein kinase HipA